MAGGRYDILVFGVLTYFLMGCSASAFFFSSKVKDKSLLDEQSFLFCNDTVSNLLYD